MYLCEMNNNKIYNGSLETYIFQLLSTNGRMYGYEISKEIQKLTENNLHIPESKLYTSLHSLESEGIIISELETVDNRLRKYYKLSQKGKTVAQNNLEKLKTYINHLQKLLSPQTI